MTVKLYKLKQLKIWSMHPGMGLDVLKNSSDDEIFKQALVEIELHLDADSYDDMDEYTILTKNRDILQAYLKP